MEGFDINRIAKEFGNYHRSLPTKVGAWAVEFYKESFRRQGYINKNFERWNARKRGDKKRSGRAILTDTGTLRRSIRVVYKGRDYVVIGSNMPYAKIHNEGGTIHMPTRKRKIRFERSKGRFRFAKKASKNVIAEAMTASKAYTVDMPKRQFMGESQFLERRIEMRITHDLERMFGVR